MDKALIIANNHYPKQPLNGCINDASAAIDWLKDRGFSNDSITLLIDSTYHQMMKSLTEFTQNVSSNDRLFFLYSGHGTQIPYENEADGYSEVLVPIDFMEDKYVSDNDLKMLSKSLPAKCRCLALFDCCYSGGIKSLHSRSYTIDKHIVKQFKKSAGSVFGGQVVSACKENETAKEILVNGNYRGAFSYWFFKHVDDRLDRMIRDVNKNLDKQTAQVISGGQRRLFELEPSFWDRFWEWLR